MILKDRSRNALANLYLFALFVLGLLLSLLIGRARSGFELSDPIPLAGLGVSVSLPDGEGWQSVGEWGYERDNSFALVARYAINRFPIAEVRWQYLLTAETGSPPQILEQQLARFGILRQPVMHLMESGGFTWTLFQAEEGSEAAVGVRVFGFGRALLLQVQARRQPMLAEDLFIALAGSVRYKQTGALETGARLIEAAAGRDFTADWPEAEAFFISDESGRKIGYRQTQFTPATDAPSAVKLESRYHIRLGRSIEQSGEELTVAPFLGDLDWTCTYRNTRPRQAMEYRLQSEEDGTIRVRDSVGREQRIRPTAVMVPEPLVPLAAALLLEEEDEEALIDVLTCRGEVAPTRLKKVAVPAGQAAAAAVRIDYFHSKDNSEELYFDDSGKLMGRREKLPGLPVRFWERATREQILLHFGNLFETPGQSV